MNIKFIVGVISYGDSSHCDSSKSKGFDSQNPVLEVHRGHDVDLPCIMMIPPQTSE